MKEIKLTLTIEEANQILDALGNQPFSKVYSLIGKIQQQAASQLQETTEQPGTNMPFQDNEDRKR